MFKMKRTKAEVHHKSGSRSYLQLRRSYVAGKAVNWVQLQAHVPTPRGGGRDGALYRVQVTGLCPERAELCLPVQALSVRTGYAQSCMRPRPAVGKAGEPHSGRVYSGIIQSWIQTPLPLPTSCVIVEKLFYLPVTFNIVICKMVNNKSYLQGLLGK